jgi:ABC-2 type transport system ATP-binding protein
MPPATRHDTVIDARALVKRYGTLISVDHVSFSVKGGEILGLLGPNGAGKTAALEMLEGLRTPDDGDAVVLGESVVRNPRTIKERIGVQLQATALPPKTTVAESIDLFGAFYQRRRSTQDLLAEFDLKEKSSTVCSTTAEDCRPSELISAFWRPGQWCVSRWPLRFRWE